MKTVNKKRKSRIAILCTAAMLVASCSAVSAFAAGTVGNDTLTITYDVEPTYTVSIPAEVTLGNTATISAEDVVVAKGSEVNVALTGASGASNALQVETAEGAVIDYTITKDSANVAVGDTVLTVNPDTASTGSSVLSFVEPNQVQYAGDYSGTVTFTVSVDNA